MMHSQFLRIETAAGGCNCTNMEFIRAAHGVLAPKGKRREIREARHEWLRDGLRQLGNAQITFRACWGGVSS